MSLAVSWWLWKIIEIFPCWNSTVRLLQNEGGGKELAFGFPRNDRCEDPQKDLAWPMRTAS